MNRKRTSLPMLLLVFLTGLLLGAHGYNHFVPVESPSTSFQASRPFVLNRFLHRDERPSFFVGVPLEHGRQTEHKEKRHGKSLITEAIVADHSPDVIPPSFSWCERHYSPYLPGGSCRQAYGNFSLRGPPSFC